MKTNIDKIEELLPGESVIIYFPKDFKLEYKIADNLKSFTPKYVEIYFWDEEDHWMKDYYLYDGVSSNWVCKLHYLTPESRVKFTNYMSKPYQSNK